MLNHATTRSRDRWQTLKSQLKATEIFEEIANWDKDKQIDFTQRLLFTMTVTNRAIEDDPEMGITSKVECLKWSNEFSHKVWTALFELKKGRKTDISNTILENIRFCVKWCPELKGHLAATIKEIWE